MAFLRTVTGDIDATQAGICYSHEHIIIDRSFTTYCNPDFYLGSVELAVEELKTFRLAGGKTLIDSMPCGGGRNANKLAAIARATDTHIVCPTGLHLPKYYPPGHWGEYLPVDALAELFIAEIEEGIDEHDLNGPSILRTDHKAGLIKIATSGEAPTDHERKIIEAAVIAQKATGAPILTHTEQGCGALEQVSLLSDLGASLENAAISHTDRKPDCAYHKEILSSGVMLEYDSAFRWPADGNNPTLDLVLAMVDAGFGGQILLGMDAARQKYWRSYGGKPGMDFLLRSFVPQLRDRGLSETDIDDLFIHNPVRCFAFQTTRAAERWQPQSSRAGGSTGENGRPQ
jgi:predicted metal-dependent phosphotriesterase family hydrolase